MKFEPKPWLIYTMIGLLACADGAYLATLLIGHAYPCDFEVYQLAGHSILHGNGIYETLTSGCHLKFTYTPFAAMVFSLFSLLGPAGFAVWTVLSLLALGRVVWLLVDSSGLEVKPLSTTQLVAVIILLALPLEPFVKTIWYGQVNILLMWLIVESFFGPVRRYNPVLSALATAVKLTPGVFSLFFFVVHGMRDRLILIGTFLVTVVLGFAVQGHQSWDYWTSLLFNADRVGPTEYVYNQSINGMLWRLVGDGGSRTLWLILVLAVVASGLVVARSLWNADQHVWAVGTVGLVALLVSPISWSHHYVLLLIVLVALMHDASHHRFSMVMAGSTYVLLLAANFVFKMVPHKHHAEFDLHGVQVFMANQYVVLALVLLAYSALRSRQLVGQAQKRA